MAKDRASPLHARYPARRLLDLIGDKWVPALLYCLAGGTRHFNEMQRQIPDISRKMLAQTLHSLEDYGLIERTVHQVSPRKTDYRLSEDGERLHAPIASLCDWAQQNEAFLERLYERKANAPAPAESQLHPEQGDISDIHKMRAVALARYVGQRVVVATIHGEKYEGVLQAASAQELRLLILGEEQVIPFEAIDTIN